MLALVLARHDLKHFAFGAGLDDMRAFHDDPLTPFGVHGDLPSTLCPSIALSPRG
jgi:hypothetical protein